MAICDALYWATLVDIGSYGSNNDGEVFINSLKGEKVFSGKMNHPSVIKYCIFHCWKRGISYKTWFMRPYSGTGIPEEKCIFSFRLSRS